MRRTLVRLFGTFAWRPPDWLTRMGLRRFGWWTLGAAGVCGLAIAGYSYYRSLPQPLRVVVDVSAPGISPLDDSMTPGEPLPLRLAFGFPPRPDAPTLSAARLSLVEEVVEAGIEMRPAHPGEWRFETENLLVFKPEVDWPAGQKFRIRLAKDLFAPNVELASYEVELTTAAFAVELASAAFVQHPEIAEDRRIVAQLRFSHPVDRASLDQRLQLSRQMGRASAQLQHELEFGPGDRTVVARSEVVPIREHGYMARVELAPGAKPATGLGKQGEALDAEVAVPGRTSYFRVAALDARVVEDADGRDRQTAIFTLTDQVDTADFGEHLRAWLLPERPTVDGEHPRRRWRSPRQVTAQVLSRATALPLSLNPTERDVAASQSATFDAPPGRVVYFRIDAGLMSANGFEMASAAVALARAPQYRRVAAVAQEGALLPLAGERELTLTARGVEAIRVEVQHIHAAALNHLASQTGGDIRDPWFRNYAFNADNISTLTTKVIDLRPGRPGERQFASVDLGAFLAEGAGGAGGGKSAKGGLFLVKVQGWDKRDERPVGRSDRRLALITDLGLLVKTNADASQHVFVHSIASGLPVAGANVELLGKNGLPVAKVTTDARGHGALPTTARLERERTPTVFVARHQGDTAFLPYGRSDRRLSLSGFDVGGEHVDVSVGGEASDASPPLRASLHTDRGLYRPGEAARLLGIVRRGDLTAVPQAPVELRVTGPRGDLALRRRDASPADGFLDWRIETRPEWPTGQYDASLYLVEEEDKRRVLGRATFKLEDYRPDQLRIRAEVEQAPERGWVKPGEHHVRVRLENLFGTPARNRRVTGVVELRPASPRFDAHPGFSFTDPYRDPDAERKSVSIELQPTTTDENGVARLSFDASQYDGGVYDLLVTTEAFETDGGRGVKALAGTSLSSAAALVGHKADGALEFIAKDGARNVSFVAVGPDGAPARLPQAQAVLLERRYVSVLVRQPGGGYGYESTLKETELEREPIALPATLALPTETPGRFALELRGEDGLKLSRVTFAVAGERNLAGELERNAELALSLDRQEYAAGDEIRMEVTAPYAGTGLVTIERDRLYAFKWFRMNTNTAMVRIKVPAELEGNGYVQVAVVRRMDSEEVLVSPLSYAVAPFSVDRRKRRLGIELFAPPAVRPGETLTLGYSASAAARLAVFAVDEGILQVAGYETPRPLEAFLRKKALQVRTHQMVDLILPDYSVIRRLRAPGGGLGARLIGANLNPFRRRGEPPVAFFSGIVEAGPERREVRFDVPDYFNGELRVMAVGVGASRLGAVAKPVTVRGPIVLTPNLPLAAAPGDVFDVSVGLANHAAGSGPDAVVTLRAEVSERLALEGPAAIAVPVAENGEARATLRVRAGAAPGAATLKLTASVDEASARREVGISVRPATPFATTVTAGFGEGAADVALPRRLHTAFAKRRVVASASPLALADGLLEYLVKFPHACAEQIVSKTFPQIGLLRAGSPLAARRAALNEDFAATLAELRPRQTAAGGFRFWLNAQEAARFPSVYIAHFLTDAREAGLPVPADMHGGALRFLADVAASPLPEAATMREALTRAYAIYVLTRNGEVTTGHLTALEETLGRRFADEWPASLTAAYLAASYKLLRDDRLADRRIAGYALGAERLGMPDFNTRLARDAQYVYLVARHFRDGLGDLRARIPSLVAPVFEGRFNTHSAAFAVLALGEVHRAQMAEGVLQPPVLSARAAGAAVPLEVAGQAFATTLLPTEVDALRLRPANDQGVYYAISESGFDAEAPADKLVQGLEVDRAYLDAQGAPVIRAGVGDELTVRLRVRTELDSAAWLGNVAVTDLLPGGFEILVDSVRDRYGDTRIEHRDVREDRLVLYGRFGPRVTEIRYRVKAVAPGDFAAPGAHAAAMYHRSIKGRSAAGRFVVASG